MIHRIISSIRCTTLSSSMSSRRRRSSGCCSISATGSQLGRTHPTNCRGRDVARREAFRLSTLMMESSLEFRRYRSHSHWLLRIRIIILFSGRRMMKRRDQQRHNRRYYYYQSKDTDFLPRDGDRPRISSRP